MYGVGYAVGLFATAFLLSALLAQFFVWLLRNWNTAVPRLLVANGLALFLLGILATLPKASGSNPGFQRAFAAYAIAQSLWLAIGLTRNSRTSRQAEQNQPADAIQPPTDAPSDALEAPQEGGKEEAGSGNILLRHWRGELPLWVSYWVFGFLGNIACIVFVAAVAGAVARATYNPNKILATLIALWLGLGLVTVWQLVGIWRSAGRHIRRSGSKVWAVLARTAVVLGILRAVVEFGQTGYPQIAESARMALLDDPDIPAYAIRLMRNGTEIEVSGGFKYGLDADFVRVLKAAPQVRVVHLNSDGGRVGEAAKLYHSIRQRGLDTYTSEGCASACTLAFAAGRERWIRQNAKLGFHAPTFPGMSASDARESSREEWALMIESGVDADFVSRALATPNGDMLYPTHDELRAARVITGIADAYKFAASGWGENLSREQVDELIRSSASLYEALKIARPQDYSEMIDRIHSGYLSGQSEGEIFDVLEGRLTSIIAHDRSLADEQVIVDQGKLLLEQYKSLAARDKQLCYEYASGVAPHKDYSIYLPDALRQREISLKERILRTASPRQPVSKDTTKPLWAIIGRQLIKRFGEKDVDLLTEENLSPNQRARYCDMAIAMYEEILKLSPEHRTTLLRANFQNMVEEASE